MCVCTREEPYRGSKGAVRRYLCSEEHNASSLRISGSLGLMCARAEGDGPKTHTDESPVPIEPAKHL